MRIFFIASGAPTEKNPMMGIFEMDQAKALKELGHEIIYISIDLRSIRRKRPFGLSSYIINSIPVEVISVPLGNIPRSILISIGEKAFKKVYRRAIKKYGKPDIVHSHFADISCMTARGLSDIEVKHVITEHSSQLNRELSNFDVCELNKTYTSADLVISVSNSLKKRIYELFGVESICIHNIVDLNAFSIIKNESKCKQFSFITVAGLNENKNITSLVQAFRIISDQYNDTKLVIVGDGPQRSVLKKMISSYGLDDKVFMTGTLHRNEINKFFSESDCFVLPSKSETFGVAYIEAMAAGLPVIATKCGGPEDFVNNENGILIDDNTVEKLVAAMIDMLNNYNKYDSMKISKYVKDRFSAENIAKQIEQGYRTVL